ncbi:MAG TPA: nucleotidyltransferase family protein [Terriglobales bacterium]
MRVGGREVLQCLSGNPSRENFIEVSRIFERAPETLLRWLDQSGLALYLANRVQQHGLEGSLSPELEAELVIRLRANRVRTRGMLGEFARVVRGLETRSIQYCVLKGFTLYPEFCAEPWLRHQSDLDILVDSASIPVARVALGELGYLSAGQEPSGELRFEIPPARVACAEDFLYKADWHRQVEIHVKFYESVNGVTLRPNENWCGAVERRVVGQISYPSLNLSHRIVTQLLHAFRHILHGWVRVGWLYEISRILPLLHDESGWRKADDVLGCDVRTREACGVVVALTNRAFQQELPYLVEKRWVQPLRPALKDWVKRYGMEWLLSDFPGSRLSLLLHREFVDSGWEWQKYRASRLRRTLGAITISKLSNPNFLARRIASQADYFWRYLCWNMQALKGNNRAEGIFPEKSQS